MLEKSHYYPGQTSQEEIVLFIRKNKIAYLKDALIILGLIILPWIIPLFILLITNSSFDFFSFYTGDSKTIAVCFLSAWYLFIMGYFLTTWADMYLDVVIITRENLVYIRQDGLFSRSVSEQSLIKVQDVYAKTSGILGQMFKVGTVIVETAGELPNFKIDSIDNPLSVANTIIRLSNELIERKPINGDGINLFSKEDEKEKKDNNLPLIKIKQQHKSDSFFGNKKQFSEVITVQKPQKKEKKLENQKLKQVNIISSRPKTKNFEIETSWIDNSTNDKAKNKIFLDQKENIDDDKNINSKKDYIDGELKEGEDLKL